MSLYGLLKLVHVFSVVVWIGGSAALGAVCWMLSGARERAALSGFLPRAQRYGMGTGAPASILVLLTGAAMIPLGKPQGAVLWIMWGYVGILVHFVFQIVVLRKRAMRLGQLIAMPNADETQIAAAGSAFWRATVIYLVLMASVIAVMVLKPSA